MKKTISVIFSILISYSVFSATIIVTNTNDSGAGSLREAITNANYGDFVKLSSTLLGSGNDTIFLASTINITKGMFIEGTYNANDTIFISGNNSVQIFNISAADNSPYSDVTLDSLALISGSATFGGAVQVNHGYYDYTGDLIITNCFFANNSASSGGGAVAARRISNNNAWSSSISVDISNSTFKNNNAVNGGAIYLVMSNDGSLGVSTVLNIDNSSILNNTASGNAGGIYLTSLHNYNGFNNGSVGLATLELTLTNSSVCQNSSSNNAGGIFTYADDAFFSYEGTSLISIHQSTISDNEAIGNGGGIYASAEGHSDINCYNSTIAYNSAFTNGSGVYNTSSDDEAEVYFSNSILALNHTIAGTNNNFYNSGPSNNSSSLHSGGYNVIDDLTQTYLTSTNDLVGETETTIGLEPLLINSNNTHTRIPGISSVAVNAGAVNITIDAQNMPIVGIRDIGASESSYCSYIIDNMSASICSGDTYNFYGQTLNQAGVYNDTLVVIGCDTIRSLTLTIDPSVIPTVTVSTNPGSVIIAGTNVTFTAVITNGGPSPTYDWLANGSSQSINNSVINSSNLVDGTTIQCVLTSNAECASPTIVTSSPITMIVHSNNDEPCDAIVLPINGTCEFSYYANDIATNTIGVPEHSCVTSSSHDIWFEFTAQSTEDIYSYTLAGTLTDAVMSIYNGTCSSLFDAGCIDDVGNDQMPSGIISNPNIGETYFIRISGWSTSSGSFAICLTQGVPSSIDDLISLKDDIKIFPNPASNEVSIQFMDQKDREVSIINSLGQVVKILNTVELTNQINISSFESGFYQIRIIQEGEHTVVKKLNIIK
jgi:hypothetical protein